MPAGVHRIRARTFRPEPQLYEQAKAAVAEVDSDMNAHINAFLRWLIRETDELPPRPAKKSAAS
ncbi:hypothetical protein [Streptomyces sp. NPDC059538]|uniref:hypothetical protein n=1 Tax=Streptomyces sp. NPDC059538 TaxID=3346860 RepID=UPI00368A8E65